jgi:hypothetical protein
MPPEAPEGEYPQPAVDPELFPPSAACNTALPVGEVIEWFDFGQFIELYATDDSGESHPLVLTQDEAVLQASLRVRDENGATPERIVDLSGGVPISRAASGSGSDAFKPVAKPETLVVDDVDDLVARGSVTSNGATYEMTLQRPQIESLRDGEPVVLRVRMRSGRETRRVWVQLTPSVTNVPVADLDDVLARRTVAVTRDTTTETIALKLEPLEIAALLSQRTVVVRGTTGSRTRLLRLGQQPGLKVGFASSPAVTDFAIKDLATFLSNPVVPGADNLPFEVPLTADIVKKLRAEGSSSVNLPSGTVLTLRLEARRI